MLPDMIQKTIYFLLLTGLLSSCGSDYLNTKPQSSSPADALFENIDNVEAAINGICKLMSTQYFNQLFNGEGSIKYLYGDYMGNDFQASNYTGYATVINGKYFENNTHFINYYPWFYYYKIIGNANTVICNIDAVSGAESRKQFAKAQALTFRAYSYLMLSQLYCKRWKDSNEGASRGLPLRLNETTGDLATSTLGQVYSRIYKDLDNAIALYTASGLDRPEENNHSPNLAVAYATYARAALTREDWVNAATYARAARKKYPLMSGEEYMEGGFSTPNREWIWSCFGSVEENLHYYAFFAYLGSNSSSTRATTNPGAISKELYEQIPETDIRRRMFLDPKEDAVNTNSGAAHDALANRARNEFGRKLYLPKSQIYAYMQFKFQVQAQPGVGHVNNFRSAEMYLIEAEADCHLPGKEEEARKLLEELNAGRNPAYSCTKGGTELLEEVKLYRRIELWGEGFDWFDYKRWKTPIVRRKFDEGGSFHSSFAGTINPDDKNGWTFVYPAGEVDYNGLIDTPKE